MSVLVVTGCLYYDRSLHAFCYPLLVSLNKASFSGTLLLLSCRFGWWGLGAPDRDSGLARGHHMARLRSRGFCAEPDSCRTSHPFLQLGAQSAHPQWKLHSHPFSRPTPPDQHLNSAPRSSQKRISGMNCGTFVRLKESLKFCVTWNEWLQLYTVHFKHPLRLPNLQCCLVAISARSLCITCNLALVYFVVVWLQ